MSLPFNFFRYSDFLKKWWYGFCLICVFGDGLSFFFLYLAHSRWVYASSYLPLFSLHMCVYLIGAYKFGAFWCILGLLDDWLLIVDYPGENFYYVNISLKTLMFKFRCRFSDVEVWLWFIWRSQCGNKRG